MKIDTVTAREHQMTISATVVQKRPIVKRAIHKSVARGAQVLVTGTRHVATSTFRERSPGRVGALA